MGFVHDLGEIMRAVFKAVQPEPDDSSRTQKSARPENAQPATAARPRVFAQVPTHAVAMPFERRARPRAHLCLPLRLTRIGNYIEPVPITLLTQNISSSGVYFLAPRQVAPGTPIELEVALVERPLGRGSVRMSTAAHVVRVDPTDTPGWHGVAVTFDDFDFLRDDQIPSPFC
jgi:hypothetical protein